MADNYLERKMEELRSGRLQPSPRTALGVRKGYRQVRWPVQRALVCVPGEQGEAYARALTQAGTRTALATADADRGQQLAHDAGVRFCPFDAQNPEALAEIFDDLTRTWRDLELAVVQTDIPLQQEQAEALRQTWKRFRTTHPLISDYPGRLILLDHDAFNLQLTLAAFRDADTPGVVGAVSLPERPLTPANLLWLASPDALIAPDSLIFPV